MRQRFVNRWSIIALSKSVAARNTLNANEQKKGEATLANKNWKKTRTKSNLLCGFFSIYLFFNLTWMWRCFCFFPQSFFPQVGGTRKDVIHGSKVKGNTKKELTQLMMGAAGKDPKASILTLFIKVNITVTLHTLKSLALVSGNAKPVYVLLGPAGRIAIFFFILFFFFLFVFFLSEALPTCVKVWPLSACLLQRAVLCSSPHPHPPARLLPPCGSLQTGSPFSPLPRPPGQEQLFQNWPTCIKFTTTAAPESVLSNLRLRSLCLSPARITLAREGGVWCVLFFLVSFMELPVCIFMLLLSWSLLKLLLLSLMI